MQIGLGGKQKTKLGNFSLSSLPSIKQGECQTETGSTNWHEGIEAQDGWIDCKSESKLF